MELDGFEAGLKTNAADVGVDLVHAVLAHRKLMSRVVTASKWAKVTAQMKSHTGAVARARALLLEQHHDGFAKYGKHVTEERPPAKWYSAERHADGTRRADSLASVVSV